MLLDIKFIHIEIDTTKDNVLEVMTEITNYLELYTRRWQIKRLLNDNLDVAAQNVPIGFPKFVEDLVGKY